MEQNYPLTPGADRSVRRASLLAEKDGSQFISAIHMLDALLTEEVVATRILEVFGVTAKVAGQLRAEFDSSEDSDDYINELLDCAWIAFRQDPEKAELESEHLLYGLLKASSPIASRLAKMGLTTESGFDFLKTGSADIEPLQVDFSFARKPTPIEIQPMVSPDQIDGEIDGSIDDVGRVLDAVGNRLREGLRVLDDYVRFVLNEPELTAKLKQLRHQVANSMSKIASVDIAKSRNVEGDVGTSIHTASEFQRSTIQDVAVANLKRVQESARSLEEFGKLIDPEFALEMKQIRYELYTLEKRLPLKSVSAAVQEKDATPTVNVANTSPGRSIHDCRLYLLVTEAGCRDDWQSVVRSAIDGGVDVIQLREKRISDRELISRARWIREATRNSQTLFIVNDRPDIAVICDADGVHVGQDEATVEQAKSIVGPGRLVGVSTHSVEQAKEAVKNGADYIGVGPVFPSTTKEFTNFVGIELIQQVAELQIPIPFFAIGGITGNNLQAVLEAGASCIAVSSAVCNAEEVRQNCEQLRSQIIG